MVFEIKRKFNMLTGKQEGATSPLDRVYWSHFVGLLWFVGILSLIFFGVLLVLVFAHEDSHPLFDLLLALLCTLCFAIAAFFGAALTFGCSQCLQAFLARKLLQKHGIRGLYRVMIAIPLLAVISWYCYDFLMPSDIGWGMDDHPISYEHGLTMSRYALMLIVQSFVTLLSLARLVIDIIPRIIKIFLMLGVLVIVPIIGFVQCTRLLLQTIPIQRF